MGSWFPHQGDFKNAYTPQGTGRRKVKKPKCLPSLGLMDLALPALGLDFPQAMPHTPSQGKPQE
jgi:hypothetical protein